MNENEIQKAIRKGKLPTSTFEKFFLGLVIFVCLDSGEFLRKNGSIIMLFFLVFMILFMIWSFQLRKKLTPYTSNMPTIKKALVLYKLADKPDVYDVKKENNSYGIYFKAGWFTNPYKSIILYDESGYYITCQSKSINNINKTKKIIERIKKLEAEV